MPDDGAPAGFVPYPVTVREGRKGGSGCEHGVLEGSQTEDAYSRRPRLQTGGFERVAIDDEAAADDEDAEPGSNDRSGASETEAWTSFDPRDLAIRDDVAEVRRELHPERDG